MADRTTPGAACTACHTLLEEALALVERAHAIDGRVDTALAASRGRCATPAAAILQRYDADLDAWEGRTRAHLERGCRS